MLGLLASLVLRWQAAAPILTIAAAPVAAAAGISPLVVAVVATIACNGFLVPYQSTTYLALYHGTGGRLFDHRLARPAALAYAAASLLALCASVPVVALDGSPLALRPRRRRLALSSLALHRVEDRSGERREHVVHAGEVALA